MNVFSLEMRNTHRSTLMWIVSITSVIFFILAFFPSMQTEAMQSLANAKLQGISPTVLAALGLEQMIDFTVISNFFGYVLQFITLAIMIYITHAAVNLFVKEESDGTIEYLYSKPISRTELFFQKVLAIVFSFAVMILVFIAITILGYILFSDFTFSQALREALIFYGGIFFAALVFMAIGILLSTTIKSNQSSSGLSNGIVFSTFIIGIVAVIIEDLDFLRYLSPMEWIGAQKLLHEGLLIQEWIIGIVIIVVCTSIAYFKYRKKDFLI